MSAVLTHLSPRSEADQKWSYSHAIHFQNFEISSAVGSSKMWLVCVHFRDLSELLQKTCALVSFFIYLGCCAVRAYQSDGSRTSLADTFRTMLVARVFVLSLGSRSGRANVSRHLRARVFGFCGFAAIRALIRVLFVPLFGPLFKAAIRAAILLLFGPLFASRLLAGCVSRACYSSYYPCYYPCHYSDTRKSLAIFSDLNSGTNSGAE